MGNISKIWPTCKIVFLTIIISRRIEHNQDMVNAIIAESTLDCIVSSYRFRAPYKGQLAPKYGRAENGKERRNGNERRLKSTCFQVLWLLLLVSKCNGRSCWDTHMPKYLRAQNLPNSLNQVPLGLPRKDPKRLLSRKRKKTSINMSEASSACWYIWWTKMVHKLKASPVPCQERILILGGEKV